MATYVYETIPQSDGEAPRRFEVVQSMKEKPLTRDPQTGAPVRRVISGGFGFMRAAEKSPGSNVVSSPAACAPGCACHAGPRIPAP